jgi:glycine oxidase
MSGRAPDVVVVGGGVIGLSAAWRLARAGAAVTVVEAGLEGRASWAAAGMLTPVTEAYWGEDDLLSLTIDSMRRWPSFASELEAATGHDIGLELGGVLAVGFDTDDLAVVDDLHRLHVERGLGSERLRSRELRGREPLLAPQVRGGLFAAQDGAVDPRRTVLALLAACEGAGVTVERGEVRRLVTSGGRLTAIEVDEVVRPVGQVVLAAGSWSGLLAGSGVADALPDLPVRPVYGEVVRLRVRGPGQAPAYTIRAVVRGAHVYVVPRRSGEVVVGATSLERGFETGVTAGGAYALLRDALAIVPALAEAELVEAIAGLRPGTPDNAPIVGWSGIDGLFLATGHYRNGILLTPVTADAATAALTGGVLPATVERACSPSRFTGATASAHVGVRAR